MRKSAKQSAVESKLGSSQRSARRKRLRGFTLIELLTVMAIIVVLAGLVLMSAGWAQKKAATSRAEAEISALSSACESYRSDQGVYPIPQPQLVGSGSTNIDPTSSGYLTASRALYQALSGDGDKDLNTTGTTSDGKLDSGKTQYMEFKPKMLGGLVSGTNYTSAYVQDPFGYSYGYYAPNAAGTTAASGTAIVFNPTFDLWSTAGSTKTSGTVGWIKNW